MSREAVRHGWRAVLIVVTALVLGSALAISRAEASGDEFGDVVSFDGNVDGVVADVLGAPDGDFVQIGTSGGGGGVTVTFDDNIAFNGPGADIRVYVVDAVDPAFATIEVGNGSTFVSAGGFSDAAGDIEIDLGALGLDFATEVRVTHVNADVLPGFDLQAVEALNQIDLEDVGLLLAPPTGENPGFTEHTVTATLTDDGNPVEGALVSFLVTAGPNVGDTATGPTDGSGEATFTWLGDDGPGLDTVTAWLDIDVDGVVDAGEPSTTAEKQWHGVTGTIDLTDADGGGVVADDLLVVTVEDRDLDTSDDKDTVEVMVFSESDPGFLLTLTETGSHTGVFQGFVQLGSELLAASGEMVTATYDDARDGEGDPEAVSATLEVGDTEEEGLKVTLCHIPGGNPENQHTITVGSSAASTHFEQHGDTFGECGVYDGPTKKEQQLEGFCERNPEHRRCDDLDAAEESSLSALAEGDDEDGDSNGPNANARGLKKSESGASHGELAAFCERKPDHRRCADYEGAGESTDSGEEGDEGEE